MECPDFSLDISMHTVHVCLRRPLLTIRDNGANDYRLKRNDNGNGSEMIYEHPLTGMINLPLFAFSDDAFSRPITRLLSHFSNQLISTFLNAFERNEGN